MIGPIPSPFIVEPGQEFSAVPVADGSYVTIRPNDIRLVSLYDLIELRHGFSLKKKSLPNIYHPDMDF